MIESRRNLIRLARERGCTVIAVTNTVGSAITRDADAVLFLQAGPEIAVVATKTSMSPAANARMTRSFSSASIRPCSISIRKPCRSWKAQPHPAGTGRNFFQTSGATLTA